MVLQHFSAVYGFICRNTTTTHLPVLNGNIIVSAVLISNVEHISVYVCVCVNVPKPKYVIKTRYANYNVCWLLLQCYSSDLDESVNLLFSYELLRQYTGINQHITSHIWFVCTWVQVWKNQLLYKSIHKQRSHRASIKNNINLSFTLEYNFEWNYRKFNYLPLCVLMPKEKCKIPNKIIELEQLVISSIFRPYISLDANILLAFYYDNLIISFTRKPFPGSMKYFRLCCTPSKNFSKYSSNITK